MEKLKYENIIIKIKTYNKKTWKTKKHYSN